MPGCTYIQRVQENYKGKIQCGNFNWNKIHNLDIGDFRKQSRNRSIFVFPCPHFGGFWFLHISSRKCATTHNFFFSNGRVCQVIPHLKAHFANNTTYCFLNIFKNYVIKNKNQFYKLNNYVQFDTTNVQNGHRFFVDKSIVTCIPYVL
jgi:hypothetical protein